MRTSTACALLRPDDSRGFLDDLCSGIIFVRGSRGFKRGPDDWCSEAIWREVAES